MALNVYNTMSGKKEEFKPAKEGRISMYVCGPTVYADCHIGHARAYVSFDAIYRYLKYRFLDHKVSYVRNITDVDDKIIKKANNEKKDFTEVAKQYTDSFHDDLQWLGLAEPTDEPYASKHMKEMQKVIKGLCEKGLAYPKGGDVYFSVKKFKGYGKLSKKNIEDLEAGARVEISEAKEDPLDFALWKKAKEGEPSWDSPWGKGRPGWHIECSAMSSKYLGETFDIHGGGRDLIFPHHENEIAQSEAYSGKPFANYWTHNGFVNFKKEKMSKSLGNVVSIKYLKKYSPDAIKLFILSSHYRSPIDYSEELLAETEKAVERVYTFYRDAAEVPSTGQDMISGDVPKGFLEGFVKAMDDDFNTAKALGLFFNYINKGFTLLGELARTEDKNKKGKLEKEIIAVRSAVGFLRDHMGLFRESPAEYFHGKLTDDETRSSVEIQKLIDARNEYRRKKDFQKADEIRKTLLEKHKVHLDDKKDRTEWKFIK